MLLKRAHDAHRIFLMEDLFSLICPLDRLQSGDVLLILRCVIPRLSLRVEAPPEPGHQPRCAQEPDRILNKAIVADQSELPILDVSDAVERVHEKTIGAFVQ